MSRTPLNLPELPSLILIGVALGAFGCAAKVDLGDASGSTLLPTTFQRLSNRDMTGIDLLLMIDNSPSMADKQATLAAAVPQLLTQLVAPNCVDANGNSANPAVRAQLGAANPCAIAGTGFSPEFNPVNNIHIGIVTSSLGDHGANTLCTPGNPSGYQDASGASIPQPADVNDQGHLVGTLARWAPTAADNGTTYATIDPNYGFLAWGNSSLPTDVSQTDLGAAETIFADMVTATHEVGCGFESQLEGWFRFLIDPVPPVYPIVKANNATARIGSDDVVLQQRAAFLRPDSLVAIVMLTDENDCSIRDTDVGWVAADNTTSIPTGSTACATNPNDKCCYSCTTSPPSGCANGCPNGTAAAAVDDGTFQSNLRCWQQKRRFGYEFLYPESRYVVGLTKKTLCPDQTFGDMDCDCDYAKSIGAACDKGSRELPNPLYSTVVGTLNNGQAIAGYPNAVARADNSSIFLAGIVGVPWQDIGTTASGTLAYIPVTDPAWSSAGAGTQPDNQPASGANGIWDMIYGDDNANIAPKDIHMVESLTPRDTLPPPTAAVNADPFNGHEYNTARQDLEYACIFTLQQPRPCACAAGSYSGCKYQNPNDCCDLNYPAEGATVPADNFDKPLCQNPAGGAPEATQYSAKGYPGLREIAVLHDYALSNNVTTQGNSVVASICPRDLTSTNTSPSYGYNPAAQALVDRMKESLKGKCFEKPLTIESDGTIPCNLVEVVSMGSIPPVQGDCNSYCVSMGRQVTDASTVADVTAALQNGKLCDQAGQPACSTMCMCRLPEETASNVSVTGSGQSDLSVCQNNTDGSENLLSPGFCYVDPERGAGANPDIVAQCPATQRRIIRFVGNNPAGGGGHPVPLPGSYEFLSCGSNVD